jgi:hypothetical protein
MKKNQFKPKYDYLKLVLKHINGGKLTKEEGRYLAALSKQAQQFQQAKAISGDLESIKQLLNK